MHDRVVYINFKCSTLTEVGNNHVSDEKNTENHSSSILPHLLEELVLSYKIDPIS